MQATLQRIPMPGKIASGKGYSHGDLLVVQFRNQGDPDNDVAIETTVESITIAAKADGSIIQLSVPLKTLLRTSPGGQFMHVIGDDRMRTAIGKLMGDDFVAKLIDRANSQIGWETTMQANVSPDQLKQQQAIVLWLDHKAKELKAPRLSEFTTRTSWELEDQPVA